MAKSTVKLAETDDQTATREAAEEMVELNQATGDKLFTVIEEIRGSAAASGTKCLVTRIASDGRSGGYCGTIAVSDFTLEKVKSLYGPGKYTVQIKGPKGFLPGGTGIEIADTGESTPTATVKPGGEFITYIEMMQRESVERRNKMNDLMLAAIPTLGTLLTALIARPQGMDFTALIAALKPAPGPTLADLSTAMVNMRALTAPEKSGGDPVDTILKVFEAAHDLSGSGSKGGNGWIDLARDAMKGLPALAAPIAQAIRARSGAAPGSPPNANIAPLPANPPVPALGTSAAASAELVAPAFAGAAAPPSETDMLALMKPFMLQKLKLISEWAHAGKQPQLYAELFLTEHLPSNFADYLPPAKALEYLNHAQWFEKTCEWESSLADRRAWCDAFRLELIAFIHRSLNPDDDDDEPDDSPEIPSDDM